MTKDDLLKPRVKIIAPYPTMPYVIGDIKECADKNYGDINFYRQFPHLFRELHWSEEREISDLPEYVKIDFGGGQWRGQIGKAKFSGLNTNVEVFFSDTDSQRFHRFDTIPADESDYNDYISSKQP